MMNAARRPSAAISLPLMAVMIWGIEGELPAAAPNIPRTARQIDHLIDQELAARGVRPAPQTNDEEFLRRVSLDLTGQLPEPGEVTLFGLDPDPQKRVKLINELVDREGFARNLARYWRDAIFLRATNQRARIAQPILEDWLTEQIEKDAGWDEIVTEMITATGDIRENGATGLMFAHAGAADDTAAEVSRLFLGIQIQCANCHDHPYDAWKREDFHKLVAYLPRVRVRPKLNQVPRTFEVASFDRPDNGGRPQFKQRIERFFPLLDKNQDGKLAKGEIGGTRIEQFFDRIVQRYDQDKDQALSLAEIKAIELPENGDRFRSEWYMPDLNNPADPGTRIDPEFFVNGRAAHKNLSDRERRELLAEEITSPQNLWFAKAFVNRVWAELLGTGFYSPLDDLGPERFASHEDVLELLALGFVGSDYDIDWLFKVIANTNAYQRAVRSEGAGERAQFAAAEPGRLRSEQLFDSLIQVLGANQVLARFLGQGGDSMYARARSPRAQFNRLFEFDPSTERSEVVGSVPQALFLMNSPFLDSQIDARPGTRLGQLLREHRDDEDAIHELYLLALSREPTEKELQIAGRHIREVENREEAFEDLLWSLINSTEFLSRR